MTDPLILPGRVECGVVMTAQQRPDILQTARRIEEMGFDSIWVGDHISFYVPLLESLTLLSFMAGVTERVRLGTSVYLLPLRHPTTTAKVAATVDVVSGGRLDLGIGVGGEFPPEFEACGVPRNERGSRANEGVEVLRKLWSGERVSHEGRHFSFGPVELSPAPLQAGGPAFIVGGRKAPAMRRARRLGDGYSSLMCSPEMNAEPMECIRTHASGAGRKDVDFRSDCFIFTILDDDFESAHTSAVTMLQAIYNRPFDEVAHKYCLLGRPEDCLEQIERFARSGARRFVLSPLMDPNEFLERASAMLPEIHALSV